MAEDDDFSHAWLYDIADDREREAAGVTNIASNVCGTDAREMIREFGREVID